ncbi:glutathione synthetase [Micractinium conductrix]|uniref:Glutathione synthetase n=1 Tax=Micractinium conductrix TaxID=554055 RepID=A0A2P6VAQ7_9CHLO|nr:glutathione synthetase [Micractinium conductrix]|eukprot:PSC71148.1 glutathione synthetase [Micractinium conductrix]
MSSVACAGRSVARPAPSCVRSAAPFRETLNNSNVTSKSSHAKRATKRATRSVAAASAAAAPPSAAEHMASAAAALDDPAALEALVEDAVVWASQHGLLVGAGLAEPACAAVHAPLALLPVPYPRATFLRAKAAALAFNAMVDAVARDEAYLQEVLAAAAQEDEFTGRLLRVLRDTAAERAARRDSEGVLAVLRSDYMLHAPTNGLLQVELNTIASSFGCLSTLVSRMHAYLLGRLGASEAERAALPGHNAMDAIADAMGGAAAEYGGQDGVVVMVVQPGERNAYDQQWLQTRLWERHGVRTLRRTLAQIAAEGRLGGDGALQLGGHRVALFYFRAGYTPADYPSETQWDARLLIERSDAFKCPTAALQLAGAKKVQQDLARPGVVERFAASSDDAALLRSFFAGLWGLEDVSEPTTVAVIEDAIQHPDRYVLKPQREGGGNNFYGEEMAARLQEARAAGGGLGAYILMQRILPPAQRSVMVRAGKAVTADTLSELGVYSTYLRRGDRVLLSAEAGTLVRTKAATSDEGGVASGYAVLDSPLLVD